MVVLAGLAPLLAACASPARPVISDATQSSGHQPVRCEPGATHLSVTGTVLFAPPATQSDSAVTSFQLTNTGRKACTVSGYLYPLSLKVAGAHPIQPTIRAGGLATGDDPACTYQLAPGKSIAFAIQYPTIGSTGCARPAQVKRIGFSNAFRWTAISGSLIVCPGVFHVDPPHAPVY